MHGSKLQIYKWTNFTIMNCKRTDLFQLSEQAKNNNVTKPSCATQEILHRLQLSHKHQVLFYKTFSGQILHVFAP